MRLLCCFLPEPGPEAGAKTHQSDVIGQASFTVQIACPSVATGKQPETAGAAEIVRRSLQTLCKVAGSQHDTLRTAELLRESLGATAVRLYGWQEDDKQVEDALPSPKICGTDFAGWFVPVAEATARSTSAPAGTAGGSATQVPAAPVRVHKPAGSLACDSGTLLIERAAALKAPAVFRVPNIATLTGNGHSHSSSSHCNTPPGPAPAPAFSAPADCLPDLQSLGANAFAALPLLRGCNFPQQLQQGQQKGQQHQQPRMLGLLWIAWAPLPPPVTPPAPTSIPAAMPTTYPAPDPPTNTPFVAHIPPACSTPAASHTCVATASPSAGSAAAAAGAEALLGCTSALEQLASASTLAFALSCSSGSSSSSGSTHPGEEARGRDGGDREDEDGEEELCWRAGAVRRLWEAGSLAALVEALGGSMARHVARSCMVDPHVQVALLPAPASPMAYMLTASPQEARDAAGNPSRSRSMCHSPRLSLSLNRSRSRSQAHGTPAAPLPSPPARPLLGPASPASCPGGHGSSRPLRPWSSATTHVHNDTAVASNQLPTANQSTSNHLCRIPSLTASRTVKLIAKLPSPLPTPRHGPDGAPTSDSTSGPYSDGQAAAPSPSPRLVAQLQSRAAAHSLLRDTSGRALCGHSPFQSTDLCASASGADVTLGVDLFSTAADRSARPPPQCLTAKPYQLENTLLRHMVQQQEQQGQGQQQVQQQGQQAQGQGQLSSCVLDGCVVPDCAQWVQDVRRPSRDVCLLMAAARGRPHAGSRTPSFSHSTSPLHRYDGGGVSPLYALSPGRSRFAGGAGEASPISGGGGGGGARSLVVLGVAVGDGSVLVAYLAFPSPLPARLLSGVRSSCVELLRTTLSPALLHKLRSTDHLAAEWATLRAGEPGAFAVLPCTLLLPPAGDTDLTPAASAPLPLSPRHASGCAPDSSQLGSCLATDSIHSPAAAAAAALGAPAAATRAAAATAAAVCPMSGIHATSDLGTSSNSCAQPQEAAAAAKTQGAAKTCGAHSRRMSPAVVHPDTTTGGAAEAQARGWPASSARGSASHQVMVPAAQMQPMLPPQHVPTVESVTHVLYSTAPSSVHLSGECLSAALGLTADSDGAVSAVATAVLDVQELDGSCSMAAHMGVLVDSMVTTLRDSERDKGASSSAGGAVGHRLWHQTPLSAAAAARHGGGASPDGSDLSELYLTDIIGEGASGVVLRGMLTTTRVAVKLIQVPEADGPPPSAAVLFGNDVSTAAAGATATGPRHGGGVGAEVGGERDVLRGRQELLRAAMEVAVLRSTQHVNILQVYGVYDSVYLGRVKHAQGATGLVLSYTDPAADPGAMQRGVSLVCPWPFTAIATELCDGGSLADALAAKAFPRRVPVPVAPPAPQGPMLQQHGAAAAGPGSGWAYGAAAAGSFFSLDYRGVYLTLLELAMALRHLHGRRLVHRDVKPANLLLKASPGDMRGWTCKLADFGYALILSESSQVDDGAATEADMGAAGHGHGLAGAGYTSPPPAAEPAGSDPGDSCWCTVQEQACGTVTHMAPEAMVAGGRIDASVDVYSFGVIMWELVCGRGRRPYPELRPDAILRAVQGGLRPAFTHNVPPAYRLLAEACWSADPRRRPSAADLVAVVKGQLAALLVADQQQQILQQQQQAQQQQPHGRARGASGRSGTPAAAVR